MALSLGFVSMKPVLAARRRHQTRRSIVKPMAVASDITHIAGQFLTTFVLFTTSLNWWYYRRIRKDHEKK